ncbi:hypothetical protein Hanom_Chr00s147358g01820761 [Helianthus anomalus]
MDGSRKTYIHNGNIKTIRKFIIKRVFIASKLADTSGLIGDDLQNPCRRVEDHLTTPKQQQRNEIFNFLDDLFIQEVLNNLHGWLHHLFIPYTRHSCFIRHDRPKHVCGVDFLHVPPGVPQPHDLSHLFFRKLVRVFLNHSHGLIVRFLLPRRILL